MDYSLYFLSLVFAIGIVIIIIKRISNAYEIKIEGIKQERESIIIQLARSEQEIIGLQNENEKMISLLKQQILTLQNDLDNERDRYLETKKNLDKTQSYFDAQAEKIQDQRKEIDDVKIQMVRDFELIANKILTEKSERFTETNQKNISQILNPLKENLKNFENKVERVYNEETKDRNSLKGAVDLLIEQSKQIQDEANNLSKALKGDNKKQGNWGEVILERILERSGLLKDQEYRLQASFTNNQGQRLQPDAIIDLPDNKNLIIDSKVSLVAYERWAATEIDEEKATFSKQHLHSIRNHIVDLSAKNYCDIYQINSPDFVLLFIPIESSFSMSISMDNDLFNFAWDRRVVLVSPSTLLATLRTIAGLWKQERQNRNVIAIAREAGLLYDKFAGFVEDMNKVEKQISILGRIHEDAKRKLDTGRGNIISKIEKLKKLGAKTTKQIDPNLLDNDK